VRCEVGRLIPRIALPFAIQPFVRGAEREDYLHREYTQEAWKEREVNCKRLGERK